MQRHHNIFRLLNLLTRQRDYVHGFDEDYYAPHKLRGTVQKAHNRRDAAPRFKLFKGWRA